MASNHTSLDAAATERKARLAKLKSLKRKQPDTPSDETTNAIPADSENSLIQNGSGDSTSVTSTYLSGRNYDPSTRGPKLGFESAPAAGAETLEDRAARVAQETREQEAKEAQEDKPIDLFKLQPKKPNWDLKRDVARKMEILNVRTENAIARLVRDRIEGEKKKKKTLPQSTDDGGQELGMKGEELVEGVHLRELEEEEDERRDRENEEI
ncbi:MAG: hypothetical protein Q9220_004276 [cf. Caloplaca sp. 1 TL-2023]